MSSVSVIGIGDDGCVGLSSRAFNEVAKAQVLCGGERQLEFFPDFKGKKILFKGKFKKVCEELAELSQENNVCVLSSGDPLFYGIGQLIAKKVGKDQVSFIPSLSSIQLAFASIKEKWDDAKVISCHGRKIKGLVNKIQNQKKVALLTDSENTPQKIADYLLSYDEKNWTVYVCENLGGVDQKVREYTLNDLKISKNISPLNICILKRTGDIIRKRFSILPEEEFQKKMPKKGLITKKEVRALAVTNLDLNEHSIVWDIGAGSGSVSIEVAKRALEGKVYAIEVDPECVGYCYENVKTHKTDNVEIIEGKAPEILKDLENPDAIFIGGSKGKLGECIDICLEKLKEKGKLIVSAITLDNVSEAYKIFREKGYFPEVQLIQVSRGKKLAHYLRYDALNPIHLFTVTKMEERELC